MHFLKCRNETIPRKADRCKRNQVKIHQEIGLQADNVDNDRTAMQTPQVTSGNGLPTKPYHTARFSPREVLPLTFVCIVKIPS